MTAGGSWYCHTSTNSARIGEGGKSETKHAVMYLGQVPKFSFSFYFSLFFSFFLFFFRTEEAVEDFLKLLSKKKQKKTKKIVAPPTIVAE